LRTLVRSKKLESHVTGLPSTVVCTVLALRAAFPQEEENTMNRFVPSVLVLACLTAPLGADALQPGRVPADARWLAHLDVEALKSSKIYEVVHEQSEKGGTNELDEGLAHFQLAAGLDPTTDFKAVTVYCAKESEKSCVAILSGNDKIDAALQKLKAMPHYHTTVVGSRSLHTWGDDHETWYGYVQRKDGSDERVVVASQDSDELLRALGVIENGAESLASARSPAIRARPASGSIFFAAAGEGLNELGEMQPVSAVAKLAKSIVLDVGEERGALFAHLALDTRKPEDALRIQQVLQGAVALLGLVDDEHHAEARARLQRIVEALRFNVSNTRVDADFRYDVKALLNDLKALEELDHKNGDDSPKSDHKHRAKKHHDNDDEGNR
jgi:hypothetical protein